MMKVLIAYASAHGSTTEIAHAIGKELLEKNINVTVANVNNIRSTAEYDALICGSAIHAGAWLPEMSSFLRAAVETAGSKPFYFFTVCIRVMERFGFEHVTEKYGMPELLTKFNVRDKNIFAGKLALDEVDWNERWTLSARYDGAVWPSNFDGDFRNWEAIHTWGRKVAEDVLTFAPASAKS